MNINHGVYINLNLSADCSNLDQDWSQVPLLGLRETYSRFFIHMIYGSFGNVEKM